ncbi:hypothetical protein [Sphingomonas astaxanthinifaciens]|uniref:Uncharacterized protein n=1 Tax=Sphingomonas astaxanthinifaciens DSM 22298 TaxID=1123267 RepID=A0ABQ5ZBX3_9SPHN|nr:hypothetical protein [Sphingomonas astaxanthinifaciens]GLR48378.1 hypothetical protein GCM10007925_20940 [Sphingomonas astaxanthinifaciens DSM 22298]
MLTLLLVMAAGGAPIADGAAQRKELVACLRTVATTAKDQKKTAADFDGMAKASCAAQMTAFKAALVAFDVKNGRPRKPAETDAEAQIGDYMSTYADRLNEGG